MAEKKTILHIIQNFGRGGAETAVAGVLQNLNEYRNIVVTLDNLNEFGEELKYDKYYSLDLSSYYLFPFAIKKLRRIIKENNVDLVHSQLYWSTILARFACPKNIPLVTSIQAALTNSVEYKKRWIAWLDKFSYSRRRSVILGVSKDTLDDYFNFLKLPRHENYVLYNFVDTGIFNTPAKNIRATNKDDFKVISVGNLKQQKNQRFLLKAFAKLKTGNITLDIFGDGSLKETLQQFITEHKLPVRLKGKIKNLNEVISAYDLFVMSSLYEGFSLAVLEGMAMGIPMLLPDIVTFREQCGDTAVYFSLNDDNDFLNKLLVLKNDFNKRKLLADKAKARVFENFTLQQHLASLREIYRSQLENAK